MLKILLKTNHLQLITSKVKRFQTKKIGKRLEILYKKPVFGIRRHIARAFKIGYKTA